MLPFITKKAMYLFTGTLPFSNKSGNSLKGNKW